MKFFAIAGPVIPLEHYCVPFVQRFSEEKLLSLIEQKAYFVMHAPRQTGKTSLIMDIARQLNAGGRFHALYVNFEGGQVAHNNYLEGTRTILAELLSSILLQLPQETAIVEYIRETLGESGFITGATIKMVLEKWALLSSKPLVLFIDEIDALVGDTLISVLRQIRTGYQNRPRAFPHALCLIGVRDVRDYRVWSDAEQKTILGGSAFNIKTTSLLLENFTREQVRELYLQHTAETGQQFDQDAIEYAYELTQGQPWLVNALANEACFALVTDRTQVITKAVIERAKEIMIARRDSHFDVLIDKLQEPRVRTIMDAVVKGVDTLLNPTLSTLQ